MGSRVETIRFRALWVRFNLHSTCTAPRLRRPAREFKSRRSPSVIIVSEPFVPGLPGA
jgi:hypothetical protein